MKIIQNWEENASQIGMVAGFLIVPIGWILQESVTHFATRASGPPPDKIFVLFVLGAVPGALLGAGASRAMVAYRAGNRRAAKWNLLGFGGGLCAVTLGLLAILAARNSGFSVAQQFVLGHRLPPWLAMFWVPFLTRNFPFHCAVAMFCCGLFMRWRR